MSSKLVPVKMMKLVTIIQQLSRLIYASPQSKHLTFESCPGAGNSTRAGILWKMKLKIQKSSLDQIFTGEKKPRKKQVEFLTFFEVYVFFQ